jgi:sulfide:quinone oxidoreductase
MTTKVLIAGGGVAALEAALAFQAHAKEHVDVEIVAPEPRFWYRPVAVAEPFGLGEVRHFDLAELAAAAGASYTPGTLVGVDAGRHVAYLSTDDELEYDVLLIACGAVPVQAVPGALTFRGPADAERFAQVLTELQAGRMERVVFAVPWGATWSLPIVELALMTAAYAADHQLVGVELTLVTPEAEPLQLFGEAAGAAVRDLLEERGVALRTGACPLEVVDGELRLVPEESLPVDCVVALPRLRGPRIDGVPQTVDGFIPIDAYCRVQGLDDVFAAGDITSFPVKQGGIASQQADAAADRIAADAGAPVEPRAFHPILRGLLLTGQQPRFLRHELDSRDDETSVASAQPLWWPPAKIVGRHLAPFLAGFAGVASVDAAPDDDALAIEIELEEEIVVRTYGPPFDPADDVDDEDGLTVRAVMSSDPLALAPHETLAEAAARMRTEDVGSAVVVDGGRLVGIVTSRDLLRAFAGRADPGEAPVREWMTADPIAVSPATPLTTAAMLMTECGFHHLPVVEAGRPIGMLGLRQAARRARSLTAIGLGF